MRLFLVLIGCTDNGEKTTNQTNQKETEDKKATLAFSWSPAGLDPFGNDSWEVMRSGAAETLIKLNEDLETAPWLAKSWKQENDTTWIIQLQDNVKFHNGKVMDATTVKESLQRTIEKNPSIKDLLQIKN